MEQIGQVSEGRRIKKTQNPIFFFDYGGNNINCENWQNSQKTRKSKNTTDKSNKVGKAINWIKDKKDDLVKGLEITGALLLGSTAIANANTNADNIFANLDAPKIEQKVEKHPSEALTTEIEQTTPNTQASVEGGDDDDTHEKLLKTNPNYKKNYEIAKKFFFDGASEICSKLALDNKLSENDSKVYLLDTYYSFKRGPEAWKKTENQKAFLIIYFRDASRNTASASEINQKFAELMGEAQDYLTNGNASELTMPISKKQLNEKKPQLSESLFFEKA